MEMMRPSVRIPRQRPHDCDYIAAFLLIGDLVRYFLFNTIRSDALAILNDDFSIGNVSEIIWTTIAAIYLFYILITGRFRVDWFLRTPYFSIFLLIFLFLLSTGWSIVPSYTLYRSSELVVWVCLYVYFFTTLEPFIYKINFLAVYCLTWMLFNSPLLVESLSQYIIFSAIKDNFLPAVGFSVAILGWTTRSRLVFLTIGVSTFVFAGSAAAAASAVAACFVGLVFSRSILFKLIGYTGIFATVGFMVAYLIAPNQFPEIINLLSNILQKSTEELLDATGRYTIWNILWDETKDNYFGSGFGSDRFIQLLGSLAEVSDRFGSNSVFIMSAHNAALSAWTAAGWPGAIALLFVFANGIRYSAAYDLTHRATATMVLSFIVINSLSIPGLGGSYSCIWLVWIATLSIDDRETLNLTDENTS
jgi:exopolysaccharide production protein ExoQ